MIIVNSDVNGENTYDITVGKANSYRVSAFDLDSAIDLVASYIAQHNAKGVGLSADELELIAKLSGFHSVEDFAETQNLKLYGDIYLEITSVKGYSNG